MDCSFRHWETETGRQEGGTDLLKSHSKLVGQQAKTDKNILTLACFCDSSSRSSSTLSSATSNGVWPYREETTRLGSTLSECCGRRVHIIRACNKCSLFLEPYRVAAGLHIAQLFSQNPTGLPLTPVCRRVERRPAIKVYSWHIHPTLAQYPRQQVHISRTAWDIAQLILNKLKV